MSVADSENTSNQEQQPVTQNGETPVAADDVVATLAAPSVACSENKDIIKSSVKPSRGFQTRGHCQHFYEYCYYYYYSDGY